MSVKFWKELRIRVTSVHLFILIAYVFVFAYFYEHYEKSKRLPFYEKKVEKLMSAMEKLESTEKQTQHIVLSMKRVLDNRKLIQVRNENAVEFKMKKSDTNLFKIKLKSSK